jgi:hypothetical protein
MVLIHYRHHFINTYKNSNLLYLQRNCVGFATKHLSEVPVTAYENLVNSAGYLGKVI